jgi:tRNA-dihydrouridine synthase B
MLGNFPSPFFLAPMAELSTPALRRLISDFGGYAVFHSEMLSAAAIVSGGFHDGVMAYRYDFDACLVFQIAGDDPAILAEACRKLADRGPYGININMSCPVSRIVKKGWGAALLREPLRAAKIVKACRAVTSVPLSVKMRSGFAHDDPEKMMAFADMLREEGADYIVLHPRFAKLYYSRAARWELVKQLKEHIGIPVVGNGDIVSPEGARQRMRETVCDGIMIGRGAVQFPWIFSTCRKYFDEGLYDITVDVRDCFLRALDYIEQYLPPHLWKSRTHRFCQYFSQNVFHSHSLFSSIRVCEDMGAIRKIIISYYERNPHEAMKRFSG